MTEEKNTWLHKGGKWSSDVVRLKNVELDQGASQLKTQLHEVNTIYDSSEDY